MTQARDLLMEREELEHTLKLQQMTPEVAAFAKRVWAMNQLNEGIHA